MRICDLIDNREFNFNVEFRIVEYTPTEDDIDHVTVLYASEDPMPCPTEVTQRWISAINQDDITGTLDIECI